MGGFSIKNTFLIFLILILVSHVLAQVRKIIISEHFVLFLLSCWFFFFFTKFLFNLIFFILFCEQPYHSFYQVQKNLGHPVQHYVNDLRMYMCKDINDQSIHNKLETKYPFTLYLNILKQYTLYSVQYIYILKLTVQCTLIFWNQLYNSHKYSETFCTYML